MGAHILPPVPSFYHRPKSIQDIIAGVLLANAAGVIMEDVWSGKRIITVDLLRPEFIESVNTGDPIAIHSDGTLEIG